MRPILAALIIASACLLAGGISRAQGSGNEPIRVLAVAYDDGFGRALKNPSGVWFDPLSQEVLVADGGNGRVVIFDKDLTALYSFKHFIVDAYTGRKVLGEPTALVTNSDGEILLADSRTDVLELLDFRGRLISRAYPSKLLQDSTLRLKASCLTRDDKDRFYVVVGGDLNEVLVLDRDLELVRHFSVQGDEPEQLNAPVSVAVRSERVYLGDVHGLPAIRVYDTLGNYLFGFAGHELEQQDLSFPAGIGFLESEAGDVKLLVLDKIRQVVKVYTLEGAFVSMIGGYGYQPGLLQYPSGLATDDGLIAYILERTGARIQKYRIR